MRNEFLEQLDDQLHDDFETAEGFLAPAPDGRVAWSAARRHDPDDDEDRGSDVWAANGEQIYRSGASASLPPVALATAGAQGRDESIVADERRWRTLTGTSLVGGRSVVLRVSRSEERVRSQLWEVLSVLVLGFPFVVVLAGVGGYVLARRALTPIDQLASAARRITAERLHERLSVPNQHDEIGRLAAVINETFARLESSFDQLRRFTADASHELRTPLAVIRGIGENGLGETRTPAQYKEAIGSMLEEVDRLTNPGRHAPASGPYGEPRADRCGSGCASIHLGQPDARRRGLARHSGGGASPGPLASRLSMGVPHQSRISSCCATRSRTSSTTRSSTAHRPRRSTLVCVWTAIAPC